MTNASSAVAQTAGPSEPPGLGSILQAEVLHDRPTSDNLFSVVETIQPEVISDRSSSGGLNTGEAPRLGAFLGSWAQTQHRTGDINGTDPYGSGGPDAEQRTGMTLASVRFVPHGRPEGGLTNLLPDGRGRNRRAVEITIVLVTALLHAAAAAPQTAADNGQRPGTITGQVIDPVDAPVSGATVTLAREGDASPTETVSDTDGRFSFVNMAAGPYYLTVSAPGFAASTVASQLAPGATVSLAPIRLTLSAGTVSIEVTPNRVIAEQQLTTQEQQRVFGIFQNFNVSYDPNAVPLDARQKFQLTWKSIVDPVQYVWLAGLVGVQQARNDFSGFGGGEEGYAKRYAAATATILTDTVLSQAVLPIVFKQDPRYFYKGTGSTSSRVGYALSRALVRRGDDGRLRPDYSRILGHLAAGALSNLYYPPQNRQSRQLTFQYAALVIGAGAINNLLQEFLLKRFTTHAPSASVGGPER